MLTIVKPLASAFALFPSPLAPGATTVPSIVNTILSPAVTSTPSIEYCFVILGIVGSGSIAFNATASALPIFTVAFDVIGVSDVGTSTVVVSDVVASDVGSETEVVSEVGVSLVASLLGFAVEVGALVVTDVGILSEEGVTGFFFEEQDVTPKARTSIPTPKVIINDFFFILDIYPPF